MPITTFVTLTDNVSVGDSNPHFVHLPRNTTTAGLSDSVVISDVVGPPQRPVAGGLTPTILATTPTRTLLAALNPTDIVSTPTRTLLSPSNPIDIAPTPTRTLLSPINPADPYTVVTPMSLDADSKRAKIIIFDLNGNIVALPQDPTQYSFEDVVNGGSGAGQIEVPRRFVDNGWINYGYRVQYYLDDSLDPWYDGRVMEIDPEQSGASTDDEKITVFTEGWSTKLADTIIPYEVLTPSAQFGMMNADTYLNHLLSTYADNNYFAGAYIPSIPVALDQMTLDGTGLNDAIDQIVQNVQDNTGQIFEWWVRGPKSGKPSIIIQPQQNPNKVTGPSYYTPTRLKATNFWLEFKDSTIYDYKIQNNARNLTNMIALMGGQVQNVQIWGAFKDSTSIALYGLRQGKVTDNNLLSLQALSNYATCYLLLHGYPQPQGSFKKYVASDFARAGQWFQIMEGGLNESGQQYLVPSTFSTTTTAAVSAGATTIPLLGTGGLTVGMAISVGSNYPIVITGISGLNVTLEKGLPNGAINNAPVTIVGEYQSQFPRNLKQTRAVKVTISMQNERIEQQVDTAAPRPFIDGAYYAAINQAGTDRARSRVNPSPTQITNYFVYMGGI